MASKKRSGIEWVGGVISLPGYVTGEGTPYQPEALIWMAAAVGPVLGQEVARPGMLVGLACESLRHACVRPMFGQPHRPDRVRVASPELAAALRAGHLAIEVVCAPTPELDAFAVALRARIDKLQPGEPSYLMLEANPIAVGAFFRAAAALFRAKPWNVAPGDRCVFSVTIEALGVRNAALAILGQASGSLGLFLFSDAEDVEAYFDAADAVERGEKASAPPHFALHFHRGAELSPSLRKEIAELRWEVASADAYPTLLAVDDALTVRPPTAAEVTIAEAIALALTEVLKQKEKLLAAWNGGEPVARTLRVNTQAGIVDVELRTPPGILERMKKEGFEEGHAQGEARGEARGKLLGEAQGKLQGKLQGEADALLRIMARRGLGMSSEHEARMRASTDLAEIERWIDRALEAKSAEEVFE